MCMPAQVRENEEALLVRIRKNWKVGLHEGLSIIGSRPNTQWIRWSVSSNRPKCISTKGGNIRCKIEKEKYEQQWWRQM